MFPLFFCSISIRFICFMYNRAVILQNPIFYGPLLNTVVRFVSILLFFMSYSGYGGCIPAVCVDVRHLRVKLACVFVAWTWVASRSRPSNMFTIQEIRFFHTMNVSKPSHRKSCTPSSTVITCITCDKCDRDCHPRVGLLSHTRRRTTLS